MKRRGNDITSKVVGPCQPAICRYTRVRDEHPKELERNKQEMSIGIMIYSG